MEKIKSNKTLAPFQLEKFPGGAIISKGLRDISIGKFKSIEALCLFTASPRLNALGFNVDENYFLTPHLMLYAKLKIKYLNDAHSQFNALMNRVTKFCNHYELSLRH